MKHWFTAAFAVLMFFNLLGFAAQASTLTGPQVVANCKAAYDNMNSYDGDVKCSAVMNSASGYVSKCTAHISFLRPGYLDVEGAGPDVGAFKPSFSLLSDGTTTWVENLGTWEQQKGVEMGIAACTGISLSAATTVPATLLHTNWGYPSLFEDTAPTKVPQETVDGCLTYKISLTSAGLGETYWIDAKTFLIKKVETVGRGIVFTQLYSTPMVDSPVSLSLYALPSQMPR